MLLARTTLTRLRRRTFRLLPVISILLTLLAWRDSAANHETVSYGRPHSCIVFQTGIGMFGLGLYSGFNPYAVGFQHFRSTWHYPTLWPPNFSTSFHGLGYSTHHSSDGWTLYLYFPFWLLLVLFTALTLYTFHRTRPRPKPTAFPITQDPIQNTPNAVAPNEPSPHDTHPKPFPV